MEQVGFWSRVGHWFRNAGRGEQAHDLPGLSPDGLLGGDQPVGIGGDHRPALAFSRRRRREHAVEQLQQGYQQVVGLVQSIQQHHQAQDRRADQVITALTQLAQTTARISEAAASQSDKLGEIAAQLEAGNDRARRWEQPLMDIPKLANAQREALGAIGRELQAGQEADRRMIETLEGFRQAVSTWGASSAAATEVLKDLNEATCRRDEDLNTLIAAQNKRFTWLFIVTLLLAVAAIATGIMTRLR